MRWACRHASHVETVSPTIGRRFALIMRKAGAPGDRVRRDQYVGRLPAAVEGAVIPLGEATRTWFAISLQTFGGPAGQIAVMQHALVDEKRWIGQKRFLHALSYCTLLPGPEAQQLAIYIGWLLNGVRGGLIAGILFVLPGVVALLASVRALRRRRRHHRSSPPSSPGWPRRCWRSSPRPWSASAVEPSGTPPWSRSPWPRSSRCRSSPYPFPLVIAVAAAVGWALGRWAPHTMRAPTSTADRRRRPGTADLRRRAAHRTPEPRPRREGHRRRAGRLGRPGRRRGGADRAATASSPTRRCSSPAPRWSPSAAPTRCWPTSPRRRCEVYGWLTPGEMVTRPGPGRDHPRPADHGGPVRGLRRRLPRPGRPQPVGRRRPRVAADHLGDVRALLRVRLRRRPLRGAAPRQPRPLRRADRHHGRRRRRHRQPRDLLRHPHAVLATSATFTWGPVHLQVPEPGQPQATLARGGAVRRAPALPRQVVACCAPSAPARWSASGPASSSCSRPEEDRHDTDPLATQAWLAPEGRWDDKEKTPPLLRCCRRWDGVSWWWS